MNTKRISLGMASIFLGLILVGQAQAFSDVDSDHKNYEAITSLSEKGIVEGYSDGTFRPDQNINRAEFLKIITESMFYENEIKSCTNDNLLVNWTYAFFPDVERNEWYANYVCMGKMHTFIGGYMDGTFRPSNNINYAEALKIIFVANNDLGMADPEGEEWYSAYLESVNAYYIGLDVEPGKELTRGEMAQLIYNYMSRWEIGKYASQDENLEISEEDQSLVEDMSLYTNEELGFSLMIPSEWLDYELKTYEMVDDMCNNAIAEVYYFMPQDSDFEIDLSKNELPFYIMRYKNEEYCNASYAWQQSAIAIAKKGDPTADPAMVYLGNVYLRMRNLQNDEYLYQIYPFQLGEESNSNNFLYTADPLQINVAVLTFDLLDSDSE